MLQNESPSNNEELLNQSVTDAELREILDRIGHAEFDGNPLPTIRDIAEGTSADPAIIGRILGDIRKEDWEKRFGLELKEHDRRIGTIEAKLNPPPVQPIHTPMNTPMPTSYNQAVRPQYGYAANKSHKAPAIAVVVSTIIIIAIMLAMFTMSFRSSRQIQFDNGFPTPTVRGDIKWEPNSDLSPELKRAVEKGIRNGTIK